MAAPTQTTLAIPYDWWEPPATLWSADPMFPADGCPETQAVGWTQDRTGRPALYSTYIGDGMTLNVPRASFPVDAEVVSLEIRGVVILTGGTIAESDLGRLDDPRLLFDPHFARTEMDAPIINALVNHTCILFSITPSTSVTPRNSTSKPDSVDIGLLEFYADSIIKQIVVGAASIVVRTTPSSAASSTTSISQSTPPTTLNGATLSAAGSLSNEVTGAGATPPSTAPPSPAGSSKSPTVIAGGVVAAAVAVVALLALIIFIIKRRRRRTRLDGEPIPKPPIAYPISSPKVSTKYGLTSHSIKERPTHASDLNGSTAADSRGSDIVPFTVLSTHDPTSISSPTSAARKRKFFSEPKQAAPNDARVLPPLPHDQHGAAEPEEGGFRDFYTAMRGAGFTLNSLFEQLGSRRGPSDREEALPEYDSPRIARR